MKKVAISQSNYIPWKGYFDAIASVDEFILYDDMQYTKRDWRNRNQIKTGDGLLWLSIPVSVKGRYHQKICDTEISEPGWAQAHWKTLLQVYGKSPCFEEVRSWLEPLYLEMNETRLSRVNFIFLQAILKFLKIQTPVRFSSEFELVDGKTERLVDLCLRTRATDYYSGPAAKDYLDESLFTREEIGVHYFDYAGYPIYPQEHGEFVHAVTVLDLLFNTGSRAREYMKTPR